jgi:HSP20 family protein
MSSEKDLFANFERMRREVDELFGDVFARARLAPRGRAGFSPAVDVYYCGDPPTYVVVRAELAGVDEDRLTLEIQGRDLVISGVRPASADEGRLYQQVEIEHGRFKRAIQLGADVDGERAKAVYEDGILRVELPLAKREQKRHTVPIESGGEDA